MGLFQRAIETYDNMSHLVGEYEENKEPLAPIGHITIEPNIEITIDDNGDFVDAKRIEPLKNEQGKRLKQKIVIPVTEKSVARSSGISSHPLCDQVGYICSIGNLSAYEKNECLNKLVKNFNEDKNNKKKIDEAQTMVLQKAELFDNKKNEEYIKQLEKWANYDASNKKLKAILTYVKKKSSFRDLCDKDVIRLKLSRQGIELEVKDVICWIVNGLGEQSGPVWKDKELMDSYRKYCSDQKNNEAVCMISGKTIKKAKQHIKGIYSKNGNAMLISSNDTSNYTYLGRFLDDEEALTVGYEITQKAHNALKWLISNQGVIEGGRVFVCWNPNGLDIPNIESPLLMLDNANEKRNNNPTEYKNKLKEKIEGYRQTLKLGEDVIIASFDAATTGRLAVTYYNELQGSDFLDRLEYWDNTCCFCHNKYGTSSPTLYSILKFVFGTQRGTDDGSKIDVDKKDNKIIGVYMERLIKCRVDKTQFPIDIMKALCNKVNNLQILNWTNRESLLFTTCAVIRKYYIDKFKEVLDMALEKNKKDRSYQYGRLLAVMEKAEYDTYDDDEKKKRQTNAIRMQSIFVKRPEYVTKNIMEQLKQAYYPKLGGKQVFYEKLIGEIMDMISECEEEKGNKPLDEKYVIGYYLQKNELWKGKEDKVLESEDSENE